MIKVEGYILKRGGEKIGYVDDKFIKNHDGDKMGYCRDKYVFDMDGRKLAYLEGDYICFLNSSHKIRIEDNDREILGGSLSDIQKAAIRVLLGE